MPINKDKERRSTVYSLPCGQVVKMLDLRSTGCGLVECNPGQVVNTHVSLSPSSIIWYRPMGGDASWVGWRCDPAAGEHGDLWNENESFNTTRQTLYKPTVFHQCQADTWHDRVLCVRPCHHLVLTHTQMRKQSQICLKFIHSAERLVLDRWRHWRW